MNLKYYLRGLGIGIVVTAILMGVATKGSGQMTDAEVKERAAQLGMVESKVLADIAGNNVVDTSMEGTGEEVKPDTEKQPESEPENVGTQPEVESEPEGITETEDAGATEQQKTPESTTEPEDVEIQPDDTTESDDVEKQPENTTEAENVEEMEQQKVLESTTEPEDGKEPTGEIIRFTIRSGETSWSVSKALAEYGLIDDASAFDKYLSRGGYDKSICVGEFDISMGASYEEIARIITKRN